MNFAYPLVSLGLDQREVQLATGESPFCLKIVFSASASPVLEKAVQSPKIRLTLCIRSPVRRRIGFLAPGYHSVVHDGLFSILCVSYIFTIVSCRYTQYNGIVADPHNPLLVWMGKLGTPQTLDAY